MKNKDYLTVRQEELMNFLWKVNEPLRINILPVPSFLASYTPLE